MRLYVYVCGDYKVTVNQMLDVEQYPLPNSQELLSALAGGPEFTTLDLKHAWEKENHFSSGYPVSCSHT